MAKYRIRQPHHRNCREKNRYSTEEEAVRSIDVYSEKIPIHSMTAYFCKKHKCWHKGHSLTQKQMKEMWISMNWWRIENQKDFRKY